MVSSLHRGFVTALRYLLGGLFLYAGLTKLLEGDLFYHTLVNTPLFPNEKTAKIGAIIIPFVEIIVGMLLIISKRMLGLYLALGLFGTYLIFIILLLFYNDTIPCTCRTVLPVLGWYGHLYFTGGCFVLTLSAIYLKRNIE
ncbi:hypothetical protein RBU60_11795 [Mesonia sp. MT50]|uniref:Methylamine utilisation protein MauE domain-containing protein n=1 Tax=Mesonia profundi TaxID=3070998 RepID=A0ABU1A3G5_9FLAO|nr:MauE/DoxX family redox-associated membrane protein [Mesonia profundi]MDQ7918260.1 hypothetical protein [Mesonia profundi]